MLMPRITQALVNEAASAIRNLGQVPTYSAMQKRLHCRKSALVPFMKAVFADPSQKRKAPSLITPTPEPVSQELPAKIPEPPAVPQADDNTPLRLTPKNNHKYNNMKQIVNRKDVERAIDDLTKTGKKATIASIHASVGGRGSLTTILKLKQEIDAERNLEKDKAKVLEVFHQLWPLALDEARQECTAEIEDMRSTIQALANENEAMEGSASVHEDAIRKVADQRDSLMLELSESNKQLTATRANADQYVQQLAAMQEKMEALREAHESETAKLQNDMEFERERNRGLEIKCARAEAELGVAKEKAEPPKRPAPGKM